MLVAGASDAAVAFFALQLVMVDEMKAKPTARKMIEKSLEILREGGELVTGSVFWFCEII